MSSLNRGGAHRLSLAGIMFIQLGLLLSGTMAFIIGAAWTNVVQSDFNNVYTKYRHTGMTLQEATILSQDVRNKNLRYAIAVTVCGLLLVVGWTILVQQIDPNWVPVPR